MKMNRTMKNWTKTVTAAIISVTLIAAIIPKAAYATDSATPAASSIYMTQYPLTDILQAEVRSVLYEKKGNVTKIGAVVRLGNTGSRTSRVPDYEIRVITKEGISYTLQPSAGNVQAIQPKEKVDLSYMAELDWAETAALSELAWVDVNDDVYPQVETAVLTVPIEGIAWLGDETEIQEPGLKWGETFQLPDLAKGLVFTPVNLQEERTNKGPAYVITLQAENKGDTSEKIPAFSIDGKGDKKTYPGLLLQPNEEIKPGEKKNIHIAVETEQNAVLKHFIIVSRETFIKLNGKGDPETQQYSVGRMNLELPWTTMGHANLLDEYSPGKPIVFDPNSKMIDSNLEVSMVDLSMNENESDGFQTAVAKLKLTNKSDRPLALPALGMELTGTNGSGYTGVRQSSVPASLMPNLSYIIHYAFAMPLSETGDNLALKMMDNQTAAPYSIPIAFYKTSVKNRDAITDYSNTVMSFYPYTVDLKYWTLGAFMNFSPVITANDSTTYSYKLKVVMDIREEENIVVDQSFSRMKIELVDKLGRILGSEYFSFTGVNRLVSGEQTLYFKDIRTEQHEHPLTINIYEAFQTQHGEAKRLVKTLPY